MQFYQTCSTKPGPIIASSDDLLACFASFLLLDSFYPSPSLVPPNLAPQKKRQTTKANLAPPETKKTPTGPCSAGLLGRCIQGCRRACRCVYLEGARALKAKKASVPRFRDLLAQELKEQGNKKISRLVIYYLTVIWLYLTPSLPRIQLTIFLGR